MWTQRQTALFYAALGATIAGAWALRWFEIL